MIDVSRSDALPVPSVTLVGEPARRLIELARIRGISAAEMLEELTTMALFDAAASGLGAPRPADGGAAGAGAHASGPRQSAPALAPHRP